MKFGFLQAYNEKMWIGWQIDQMMKYCDKMLITEGSNYPSFSDISERSIDGTLDIISDKMKEYPNRISLNYTIRKHQVFNSNKASNFNRALTFCNIGDYFIKQDADEFYTDEHIARMNEQMKEGKADVIYSWGYCFAFSFMWRRIRNGVQLEGKDHITKKNPSLYFIPTHQPQNKGPVVFLNKTEDCLGRRHYSWVKLTARSWIQHRAEQKVMRLWFEKNWEKIALIEDCGYFYYNGEFKLRRFSGLHPESLDDHPWRHVEDVRKAVG